MVKLIVKTWPVRANVILFRVAGRYGILKRGLSPVVASRDEPWTWRIDLSPVIDEKGVLWLPAEWQYQGLVKDDATVNVPYFAVGARAR